MNWHKLSPALLTLLVFLLAQGIGTLLIVLIAMLVSPELRTSIGTYMSGAADGLPLFETIPAAFMALTLIAVDIIAVLFCYFPLRYIRPVTAADIASIRWRPGLIAVAAGILGALSISILTEKVQLPDVMLQMMLAMSHNLWGLLALIIIGPIAEELLFREAIEGEMLRRGANPWLAIIVSAIAFGAVHLNLAQGLYALPLAILFGIIYYKTGNIVLTSLLHILNNGIAALQLYTLGEGIEDISYAEWFGGSTRAYTFTLLCGILSLLLIKIFWKSYPTNEKQQKKALPERKEP